MGHPHGDIRRAEAALGLGEPVERAVRDAEALLAKPTVDLGQAQAVERNIRWTVRVHQSPEARRVAEAREGRRRHLRFRRAGCGFYECQDRHRIPQTSELAARAHRPLAECWLSRWTDPDGIGPKNQSRLQAICGIATLLDLMQQLGVVPALGVSDDDAGR
jgi:hypothetical protein